MQQLKKKKKKTTFLLQCVCSLIFLVCSFFLGQLAKYERGVTDRRKHVNEIPSDVVTKFINTTANQMFKGVCFFLLDSTSCKILRKKKKAEPEQKGHLVVLPQYLMEKMQKTLVLLVYSECF